MEQDGGNLRIQSHGIKVAEKIEKNRIISVSFHASIFKKKFTKTLKQIKRETDVIKVSTESLHG